MCTWTLWIAVGLNLIAALWTAQQGWEWRQFLRQYQRYVERLEEAVLREKR